MQLSQQLFLLVKSLSTAEKGYFRKQVLNSGNATQKYALLFNALDKMDAYSEDALKKAMGKANTKGNLTNTKRYLLDLITESLQQYNFKDLPIMQVNRLLQAVEVLIKKKLYELCHDHLDRATKIAEKHDLLTSQLTILSWRYRLAIREGKYDQLRVIGEESYGVGVTKLLGEIKEKWQLIDVQGKVMAISADRGSSLADIAISQIGPLLDRYPIFTHQQTAVFSHKLLIHTTYSAYYRMIGKVEEAFDHSYKAAALFRQFPEQIEISPRNYMSVTVNLANRCIVINKYPELLEQIGHLKEFLEHPIAKRNNDLHFEIRAYMYELELMYMHFTESYALVTKLYPTIFGFMRQHTSEIKKENLAVYYYFLGHGLYRNGSRDKGYELLKEMLDDHKDIARMDLMLSAQLVLFLMHYEMGNKHLLPHQIKAIAYYTKSRQADYEILEAILAFYKALCKTDKKKLTTTTNAVLTAWNERKAHDHDNTIIENFDLPLWIATHKPYRA